jgi:protein AFG1
MRDCHLLCFDEFQVTDIADALNMKQLFSALFERGLIILCTSNRHPDNLYEHGLQRQNFVPFIPMLKSQVSVINLDTGKDYRKSDVFDFNHPSWLIKNDPKIEGHIKNLHLKFGKGEEEVLNSELTVLGHKLKVPRSKGAVAHFSFNDLCLEGLGVPLG